MSLKKWMMMAGCASALSGVLLINTAFAEKQAKPNKKAGPVVEVQGEYIPFNEEIYTLAYKTFLANNNIDDAYKLAQEAVKQRPKNKTWRQRLAIAAAWKDRPIESLTHWYHIAINQKTPKAIDKAIGLAKLLHDDIRLEKLLTLKLSQKPGDASTVNELIAVKQRLGSPELAAKLLEDYYQKTKDPIYLEQLAKLYRNLGNTAAEASILKQLSKIPGSESRAVQREAELLYSRGEFMAAYQKIIEI